MLGLTPGELFVVVVILVAVVSAPLWPRAGEAVARAIAGGKQRQSSDGDG